MQPHAAANMNADPSVNALLLTRPQKAAAWSSRYFMSLLIPSGR